MFFNQIIQVVVFFRDDLLSTRDPVLQKLGFTVKRLPNILLGLHGFLPFNSFLIRALQYDI